MRNFENLKKESQFKGYDFDKLRSFILCDDDMKVVSSKRSLDDIKKWLSDDCITTWVCPECMFTFSRNDLSNIIERLGG